LSASEHFEDSNAVLESIENEAEDIQTFHIIGTPMNTMKLVNLKSYNLVTKELSSTATLAEVPKISFKIDDNKDVYIMTNKGNSVKLAVKDIAECKFRDKGTALFNLVKNIDNDENIVAMLELDNSIKDNNIIFVTKNGMVKITKVSEFLVSKHVIASIKLGKNDKVVFVGFHNPDKHLSIFTANGNAVKVPTSDIPVSGRVGIGVKGIALDKNDYVVSAVQTGISDAYTMFFSDGSAKIVKQTELTEGSRNRKGLNFIGTKTKGAKLVFVSILSTKVNYVAENLDGKLTFVAINQLPIDTRVGSGKVIVKSKIKKVYPFIDSQK
jgi:DNA gyrase/topoisomerase IV subunit A